MLNPLLNPIAKELISGCECYHHPNKPSNNQKYIQNRFNKNECYCSCTNKKISGYFYLTEYKTGCDFHNFSKSVQPT